MRRKRRRRAATWSIPLETTLYSMFHNVLRRSWSSLLVVTASTSEFVSETRTRRALDTGARFHEESEEACYSSSSSRRRRRWNCRLVAQDQSFDFIQEPSNINWRRLESDCCLRVGIPSADAILVPVLPDVVPLFHLSVASQIIKTGELRMK